MSRALTIVCALAELACAGLAQSNPLIGTWKLVSARATTERGETIENPYGSDAVGFITYTADGRVAAILMHSGRKRLSVNDRISAPAEERAEAFATMFAYAGRFEVDGTKVTHHVEAASVANWVNTDLIRSWKRVGGRLTLLTPPTLTGGVRRSGTELVWERVR